MQFSIGRDERSATFFDGTTDGVLLVRRCGSCGRSFAPHVLRCATDGNELTWAPSAGTATLVTWAVEPSTPLDPSLGTPDGHATVCAMVELAEGPWMYAAIVDADPATLHEGTPLTVRFVRPGGGEAVPVFTPAG